MFIHPYGLYGLLFVIIIFGILIFMVMNMGFGSKTTHDKERNFDYSDKGDYGTAGFMSRSDMDGILKLEDVEDTCNTILGKLQNKVVCVPTKSLMNKNIAVYGASGSMKSRAFVRNMVFQCVRRGESLILTDPKSELFADMALYLEANGYDVKAFNLVNPENSDSWNCLMEIEGNEMMAQLLADIIIKNTGSNQSNHFWDDGEMDLLKALILYVEQGFTDEHKNIGQVYQLLTMSTEKELNALFDSLPLSHPAKAPHNIFKQASDTVRTGVIIGLGSRLQVFQNQLIREITSHDEIKLTKAGIQKCAYFCITSDQDSTFDFLSSLFISFVFIKLVKYADKHGESGNLAVPVHILADELANIGVIPDLTKKISTIRSRNISLSCVFQNLPQMQNRYPDNQYLEIIGNCDVQLFLGCTDDVTAKFISDRAGEITINTNSQSKQFNSWKVSSYTPDYRETYSLAKRKLLTPDEILRLPLNKALVIVRGQNLLEVEKFDYSLHPESKKLVFRKAAAHVPEWRKGTEALNKPDSKTVQQKTGDTKADSNTLPDEVPAQISDSDFLDTILPDGSVDNGNQQKNLLDTKPKPNQTPVQPSTVTQKPELKIISTDKNSIMS